MGNWKDDEMTIGYGQTPIPAMDRDEIAAIAFCRMAGIDPEQYVSYDSPKGHAVALRAPLKKVLASKARNLRMWMRALKETEHFGPSSSEAAK